MFEYVKLPELDFELEAITSESGRVYLVPSGNKYNSITTILKPYNQHIIENWREAVGEEKANKISGMASRRGEALHLACEKYLLNEMDFKFRQNMMPNIKQLFLQLKPEIDKNIGKIYAIEQPLYSDELQVAGRVDLIAEWDGELAVIDFKSAGKEKREENIRNYFMQCSGYAEMFEERTGMPIENIVVIIANIETARIQIFEKQKHDYLNPLKKLIEEYGK